MPEYLSPGVYVEEISTGPKPIEGVSTSTTGFVGQTERGPTTPRLVTSWLDFQRWFGSYIEPDRSYLPYAVRGFFDNGGRRVFIARVTGGSADPASAPLPTEAGGELTVTAVGAGTWGDNLLVRVAPGSRSDQLFRLTLIYYAEGLPEYFVDPTNPANRSDPHFEEPDVIEDFDNLSSRVGSSSYVLTVINAASRLVHADWASGSDPSRPDDVAFGGGGAAADPTVTAALASAAATLDPIDSGNTVAEIDAAAAAAKTDLDTAAAALADGTVKTAVNEAIAVLDPFTGTKTEKLAAIDTAKARITFAQDCLTAGPPIAQFSGGNDGDPLSPAEVEGDGLKPPDERTGLAGLEAIDEIAILAVPDHVNSGLFDDAAARNQITNAVLNQCERLLDRFGVLSVERGQGTVQNIFPVRDTSYGAIYYPWIRVFDQRTRDTLLVPPTGHVIGIYARTDNERGVHKAPANETVRGIITRDLNSNRGPLEYKITKGEHDILNPRGINVIRDFRADRRGIRVWGARTMSSDGEWKYVSVRRLFIFIEESIDEGTQWVVFEPNHEPTWARVVRSVSNFLLRVWRDGALQGVTQEEAFFVKCDRSTISQDDIDNGRLICYIGIAPVKPAEFVIFRISQKTIEATA